MIYTRRRQYRYRMMMLATIKNRIRDLVSMLIGYLPDLMALVGVAIVMFYLLPMFFAVIAAAFQGGVM